MIYASQLDWVEAKYSSEHDKLVFRNELGEIIVDLQVPNGLLRKLIDANAASAVHMKLDGTVHSEIDEAVEGAISHLAIDELVARDTAPDMLEDESDAETLLQLFERRLRRSLEIVGSALNRLQNQNRH